MLKKNKKKSKNSNRKYVQDSKQNKDTFRTADKTEYQKRKIEIFTFKVIKNIMMSMKIVVVVVVNVVDVVVLKKRALCVLIFMFWCFSH